MNVCEANLHKSHTEMCQKNPGLGHKNVIVNDVFI